MINVTGLVNIMRANSPSNTQLPESSRGPSNCSHHLMPAADVHGKAISGLPNNPQQNIKTAALYRLISWKHKL